MKVVARRRPPGDRERPRRGRPRRRVCDPIGIDVIRLRDDPCTRPRTSGHRAAVPELELRGPDGGGGRRRRDRPAGAPARLFCALGDITNLAVARGPTCLFTRVSTFGIEGIAQRLAERRELTLEHARQWIAPRRPHRRVETIDGDPEIVAAAREVARGRGARSSPTSCASRSTTTEPRRAPSPSRRSSSAGPGSTVPGLPRPVSRELGYAMRVGRPAAARRARRDADAARLTLPFGLGWRQ